MYINVLRCACFVLKNRMKKKKLYFKNIINHKRGVGYVLARVLLRSLFYNVQVSPNKRFIYKLDSYYTRVPFLSKVKLRCFMSVSRRVPSRGYFLSRFFLNKYIDNLSFGGVAKL